MVVHSEKEAHVVRLTQQLELLVAHPERVGQIVRTPDSGVHVARSSAQHKQQVVLVAESFDCFPVLVRRSKGKAIRSKVGGHPIKPARQDVLLVTLLHNEGDEDAIIRSSSETVRAPDSQQLSPGLRWGKVGVIHIKEWKDLPSAGLETCRKPHVSHICEKIGVMHLFVI